MVESGASSYCNSQCKNLHKIHFNLFSVWEFKLPNKIQICDILKVEIGTTWTSLSADGLLPLTVLRSFWCRNVWQHFTEATWHKCQINFTRFRIWGERQIFANINFGFKSLTGLQLTRALPLVVQIFGPTCPMLKRWNKLCPLQQLDLVQTFTIITK